MMSNGGVRFAVKLSAYSCFAACFVGSLIYDEIVVPPGNLALRFSDFGGKWKYLTHLNMVSTYTNEYLIAYNIHVVYTVGEYMYITYFY